jgi:hypothetical protein
MRKGFDVAYTSIVSDTRQRSGRQVGSSDDSSKERRNGSIS